MLVTDWGVFRQRATFFNIGISRQYPKNVINIIICHQYIQIAAYFSESFLFTILTWFPVVHVLYFLDGSLHHVTLVNT